MKKGFWLAPVLASALIGCAGTAVKSDQIASIESISVDPIVKVPDALLYYGPDNIWAGLVFGGLGDIIATSASPNPERIKTYLAQTNINVGEISRREFLKGLKADPEFSKKLSEKGTAHFELEVVAYGLLQKNGVSSEFKVILSFKAKLIGSTGNVLWKGNGYGRQDDETVPVAPFKAYFADPSTFRAGYEAAADSDSRTLLKELHGG